jgi:hypothetical protein
VSFQPEEELLRVVEMFAQEMAVVTEAVVVLLV